jgi:hypothetical protein
LRELSKTAAAKVCSAHEILRIAAFAEEYKSCALATRDSFSLVASTQ